MTSDCGCGCDCDAEEDNEEDEGIDCPECGERGKGVPQVTVLNLLKKESKEDLQAEDHYLCMNPSCKTAYYSQTGSFSVEQVRRPIWFKENSEPKIACYCNDITYDQVEEAVEEHQLKTWKDIVSHHRDKRLCMCEKLNPAGECCSDNFYRVVNRKLKSLDKDPLPPGSQRCG